MDKLYRLVSFIFIAHLVFFFYSDLTEFNLQAIENASSFELSSNFVNNLYHEIYLNESDALHVFSEYYSFPLIIRTSEGTIIKTGEDIQLEFIPFIHSGPYTSHISDSQIEYDHLSYYVKYRQTTNLGFIYDFLKLKVDVLFGEPNQTSTTTKITKINFSSSSEMSFADVFIDNLFLGRVNETSPNLVGQYVSGGPFDNHLSSLRYTTRHGLYLGYMWTLINNDTSRIKALQETLDIFDFQELNDIYAPIFGMGKNLSDNFVYNANRSGPYKDCYEDFLNSLNAYRYTSKVCVTDPKYYIEYAKSNDWLSQGLQAIHLLNKYDNPDLVTDDIKSSPRQIARMMEAHWNGYGISHPSDLSVASGLRTAVFLILETLLGYDFNDTKSRELADKSFQILDKPQIKENGLFISSDDNQYLRPYQTGGYFTHWTKDFKFKDASHSVYDYVLDLFNTPSENPDIIVSNVETNVVILQSIRVYECYRENDDCFLTP